MINPTAIRTYCEIVFRDPPPGGMIALRGFAEPKGSSKAQELDWIDPFARHWMAGVESFVRTCDKRGCSAYCIPGYVNGRRANAADVLTIPTLLIDFDAGDIANKATKAIELLRTPSLGVHSGGMVERTPKSHLYWRLTGEVSAKRVARLRGLAARIVGADTMFEEGREHQPIRIAGSVHRKNGLVPVEITYSSDNVLDVADTELKLRAFLIPSPRSNCGSPLDDSIPSERPEAVANALGLSRQVTMDELSSLFIGHGKTDINRFEGMTRMIGMFLSNINDINDAEECERNFDYFRQWAVTHIENIERDYDLRQHWRGLLRCERLSRSRPRVRRRPKPRTRA